MQRQQASYGGPPNSPPPVTLQVLQGGYTGGAAGPTGCRLCKPCFEGREGGRLSGCRTAAAGPARRVRLLNVEGTLSHVHPSLDACHHEDQATCWVWWVWALAAF